MSGCAAQEKEEPGKEDISAGIDDPSAQDPAEDGRPEITPEQEESTKPLPETAPTSGGNMSSAQEDDTGSDIPSVSEP
ncbi:hypothetical protein GF351_02170 [Candidatus Woesearchaeota archaeon]|nr:hypothetical protein [Candidatus Woesearchaeota archaeon]